MMTALGLTASALYDEIDAASSPDQLDICARTVWAHWGKRNVSDDEATFLDEAIYKRRPGRSRDVAARRQARQWSRFTPRQRPRSPDRQASRERRRTLGGSGALPNTLRALYTEGQRAVLCIIAGEIKAQGICDLPIDKIAALAGVCRTTVQTTLHEARRLGHLKITERPVPGRKHRTNLIEIVSGEWRNWIKRGEPAHRPIGSKSLNLVSPTKKVEREKERPGRAEEPKGAVKEGITWGTVRQRWGSEQR